MGTKEEQNLGNDESVCGRQVTVLNRVVRVAALSR